jgi:ectoine hydroxylase-related dioxygenase (phytanoyl-CoA dioxygenase family)
MIGATDNLPDLESAFEVPDRSVLEFRDKGHTVVRGLASAEEVAAYRPDIERVAADRAWEKRPLAERDTYGKAFLQACNLWQVDAAVQRFVFAHRFADAAAQLLGVERVRLYHDQALIKEAGGGPTPWHQDQYYWPFDGDTTITMWMPLVDIPDEIGSMTFASGSHRMGYLGEYAISDESEHAFRTMIERERLPLETHGALAAGDATFHAGWTLHSAGANPTGTTRPVMTVIYFADGLHVSEPERDAQRFDLAVWLPGLQPGDRAATPTNPVL